MFARHLRTYLFTSEPITEIETEVEDGLASAGADSSGSLSIGSLKGGTP
jgi:hypothetical protein